MIMHSIKDQLILHEGLRLKPYKCPAGYWTIGVGRNLETVGLSKEEQLKIFGAYNSNGSDMIDILLERGISEKDAMYLLDNDIKSCIEDIEKFTFFEELSPVRQKVLIDMRFNLGFTGLRGFKKMLAALERGDYVRAASEMIDSAWFRQVGDRGKRLYEMMRTGRDYK